MTVRVYSGGAWSPPQQCRVWRNDTWEERNIQTFHDGAWRQVYSKYEMAVLAHNPLVYYRLGDGTNTTAGGLRYRDHSGNDYHLYGYQMIPSPQRGPGALPNDTDMAYVQNDPALTPSANVTNAQTASSNTALDGIIRTMQPGSGGGFAVELWWRRTIPRVTLPDIISVFSAQNRNQPNLTGSASGWYVAIPTTATWEIQFGGGANASIINTSSITQGKWHYIACNYGVAADPAFGTWLDGTRVQPFAFAPTISYGAQQYSFNLGWPGVGYEIDEIAVYRPQLTPQQIQAHYQAATQR